MPYRVKKVDVWTGEMPDRAGGLAEKLRPLAEAGVDLQMLFARPGLNSAGEAVMFLAGVSGAKGRRAAQAAGLVRATDVAGVVVEGPNRPGACQALCDRLAEAGINLRGLSAQAHGKTFVMSLAFDSAADARKAAKVIREAGKAR